MSATYAEAYDEILALFKTAWDTTGYSAHYTNVGSEIPTTTVPWARAQVQLLDGFQSSLSGANAQIRWERQGIFTTQIFVPVGNGLLIGHSLSKTVTDAFEGVTTASGVWFRNARVNEIGPDGDWFQINVLVDFTYDEVK